MSDPLPEVVHGKVHEAVGNRLIGLAELPASGVAEVRTSQHGVIAVGLAGGEPFAVSNLCRHQFAKLGRGTVQEGCLECPWHRARYDVRTGAMVRGPQGRVFGLAPYSAAVRAVTNATAKLQRFAVAIEDGVIVLT